MTRINLVAWIMLLGFGGTLSTSADALTRIPRQLAGAGQGQHLLVQYNNNDDDDDAPPARTPSYNYPSAPQRRGNDDAVIMELFRGGAQILQQQQRQQQQQQQQQRRNMDAQRARERAAQDARRRAQEEQARRAREAREKQQRDARERARQQELQKLKDEAAVRDRKNNLQNAVQQEKELQDLRDKTARKDKDPDDYPDPDEYRRPDKVDDIPVDVVLVPQDDRPPIGDLPELVVGPSKLPACGYVTLPARPELCRGRTASGGWLRVVNVRLANGGNRTACVTFCPEAPTIVLLKPKPKPKPVVTPVTPKPVDPPPRVVEPAPKPKPTYPSAKTVLAGNYVEPKPKPVPAEKTVLAGNYVQPKPKPVPAAKTVLAGNYVQPKPKPVPAEKTVLAGNYVQPKPTDKTTDKKPTTPPQKTVLAKDPTAKPTEPDNPDFGFDSVVDDPKDEQKKPPVRTAIAPDPQTKKPGEPDNPDFGFDSFRIFYPPLAQPTPTVDPCYDWVAARRNQPRAFLGDVLLNEPALRGLEASRLQYEEAARTFEAACKTKLADDDRKKKIADEQKKKRDALLNPVMDGKCTTDGGKPAAKLVRAFPVRETAIGAVSAIPASATGNVPVGAIVGGIMKLFWKDDGPDSMFKQIKDYVDEMVDGAISNYDKIKLEHDVKDLNKLYHNYDKLKTASTKGRQLEGLIRHLNGKESNFLDPQSPEKTLAEFVAYGSLNVAALQELSANYDQYVPFDPTNKDAVSQHEEDRNTLIQTMNEAIKAYKDHVAAIRKKIIEDRVAKVRVEKRGLAYGEIQFMGEERPMFQDYHDWFTAKDDFCGWDGPGRELDEAAANADAQRRKDAVRQAYNNILDVLLEPVSHWPSATPTAAPMTTADATPRR